MAAPPSLGSAPMASLDDIFANAPNLPGRVGYLEKKSGGKAGRFKPKMAQKWTRRFFVLAGQHPPPLAASQQALTARAPCRSGRHAPLILQE